MGGPALTPRVRQFFHMMHTNTMPTRSCVPERAPLLVRHRCVWYLSAIFLIPRASLASTARYASRSSNSRPGNMPVFSTCRFYSAWLPRRTLVWPPISRFLPARALLVPAGRQSPSAPARVRIGATVEAARGRGRRVRIGATTSQRPSGVRPLGRRELAFGRRSGPTSSARRRGPRASSSSSKRPGSSLEAGASICTRPGPIFPRDGAVLAWWIASGRHALGVATGARRRRAVAARRPEFPRAQRTAS